ncbi:MAG: BA14K family protein [Halieaceae bacterium]|nr:BA14K family protein [Halieaceae bacterium]
MKMLPSIFYAAIALSLTGTFSIPLFALPLSTPNGPMLSSDTGNVEERVDNRKEHKRSQQSQNTDFRYDHDSAYFNDHRGYRQKRSGYRQYNGWWFPPAAFFKGAAIDKSLHTVNFGDDHYEWCAKRYTSYRDSDNTFQPRSGGSRRLCVSPYS